MDASSHFFEQCLELEDPHPYQDPGHDVEGHPIDLTSFSAYDGKIDFEVSPHTQHDGTDLDIGPEYWGVGDIPQVDGSVDAHGAHHKLFIDGDQKLFVDPDLSVCRPESDPEDIKTNIQMLSMDLSRPSMAKKRAVSSSQSHSQRTSKASSTSAETTPPEQDLLPQSKKRKRRKIKKENSMIEENHKRNRFLERNRIAASKCREKKKVYVSELEETKLVLEAQNATLSIELNTLLEEISGLKHHLMAHAKCNDPNIDRWLTNEARRFVQNTNETLFGSEFNFGPGSQAPHHPVLTPGSPRSRNPSTASSQFQSTALPGGIPTFEGVPGPRSSISAGSALGSDRQGSITYPAGPTLYASPADTGFPTCLDDLNHTHPMRLKKEPGINYDHMPESMFSPEPQGVFGAG